MAAKTDWYIKWGQATTTQAYDLAGQVTSIARPGGGSVQFSYDAAGNRTVETRVDVGVNLRTTFTYDNLNRLVVAKDAEDGVTTFAYDLADNRTLVIDPVGNRTTSAYDALNRLITETDPLGDNATFAYDAASRLTSTTDRLGQRRDFTYSDIHQKLTEKWYDAQMGLLQTQTFTYDSMSRMLSAVDPDGVNTFTYDALGRMSTAAGPWGLSLTYTYDSADNRIGVQDSKGGLLTNTYNAVNLLTNRQFTGNSATLRFDYAYSVRDEIEKVTRY